MKAVTQNLDNGRLSIEEVPPPILKRGGVLVHVRRSLISLGTEKAVIALANKGPLGKAKDRPDLVRKVLNKARQEGYWSTYQVVKHLMSTPIPLGYSCAGDVIEVGADVDEFRVGDRVACAGLGYANHAEVDYIPRNLAARLPDALSYEDRRPTPRASASRTSRLANGSSCSASASWARSRRSWRAAPAPR
jgi:hypothetical protein